MLSYTFTDCMCYTITDRFAARACFSAESVAQAVYGNVGPACMYMQGTRASACLLSIACCLSGDIGVREGFTQSWWSCPAAMNGGTER